ncbi:snpC, partial [Symbiodinium microadriaticum]
QQGDRRQAATIFHRSAMLWGVSGEVTKTGEFLIKAAKELEDVDPAQARDYYYEGLGHIIPEDTPTDMMSSTPALAPDMLRAAFSFLLKLRASSPDNARDPSRYTVPTQEVLSFAARMLRVYEGLESEASLCRMMVTITILQLELGDVVAADRTFLDHLGSSAYLKSVECKLAEDFLQAFKQMDVDLLDEAQRSHHLIHLDRDVQKIAATLSLMASHNAPDPVKPSGELAPKQNGHESTRSTVAAPDPVDSTLESADIPARPSDDLEDFDAMVMGHVGTSAPEVDDDEIDLT